LWFNNNYNKKSPTKRMFRGTHKHFLASGGSGGFSTSFSALGSLYIWLVAVSGKKAFSTFPNCKEYILMCLTAHNLGAIICYMENKTTLDNQNYPFQIKEVSCTLFLPLRTQWDIRNLPQDFLNVH
jgi:hypothetical protein